MLKQELFYCQGNKNTCYQDGNSTTTAASNSNLREFAFDRRHHTPERMNFDHFQTRTVHDFCPFPLCKTTIRQKCLRHNWKALPHQGSLARVEKAHHVCTKPEGRLGRGTKIGGDIWGRCNRAVCV